MEGLLSLVGHLHPAVVHFPIGLLFGVALLELLVGRRESRGARRAIDLLLIFAALSALVAVGAGLLLVREAGYNPTTSGRHRTLGIAVALGSIAAAALHHAFTRQRDRETLLRVYRLALVASLMSVVLAGHFGRTLAHGSGYLDRYLAQWLQIADEASTTLQSVGLYEAEVQPLLEDRCYSCHGSEKQKGDLRLDREAHARQGGESGNPAIVPGEAARSEIVRRVLLPEDHEDAMPQKGERLTVEEVMRVVEWINAGGRFHSLAAPDSAAISRLEAGGALASRVTPYRNEMRVDFSLTTGQVGAEELSALTALAPQLVWLSLAGRELSGPDIAMLSQLANLSHLHLERTDITDSALVHLSQLAKLEYLNLYQTRVSDTGLEYLASLERLTQLYVWQTNVSSQGAEALAEARPGLEIVLGLNDEGGYEVVRRQPALPSGELGASPP